MPTVSFRGREIDCEPGVWLREVLLAADETPHNRRSSAVNCGGHGTCGTCAVEVVPASDATVDADHEPDERGPPAVSEPTTGERLRLSVPPHESDSGLRLACQTRVHDDVVVRKYPGFWGQHVDRSPE
jgi:ferredoxin